MTNRSDAMVTAPDQAPPRVARLTVIYPQDILRREVSSVSDSMVGGRFLRRSTSKLSDESADGRPVFMRTTPS